MALSRAYTLALAAKAADIWYKETPGNTHPPTHAEYFAESVSAPSNATTTLT